MEFAKTSEMKVGIKLKADAGFTCLKEGDIRTVFETIDGRLAIACARGIHTLDSQYDHGKDQIVGLYPV